LSWLKIPRIRQILIHLQSFSLGLAMIMKTDRECIRVIENTDRDIDTFGTRFKAE